MDADHIPTFAQLSDFAKVRLQGQQSFAIID